MQRSKLACAISSISVWRGRRRSCRSTRRYVPKVKRLIRESGMAATFVRPWYVLGPGRRWPYALIPLYALARLFPATRDGAQRLALVTLQQMTQALAWAVENPPEHIQTIEPPQMRAGFTTQATAEAKAASA